MSQHLNKFQEELRRTVRIGAGLLLSIIAAGTVGYYFIEKLNILDSL